MSNLDLSVSIRAATIEDVGAIAKVHVESIRGLARSHYTPEQVEAWSSAKMAERYPILEHVMYVAIVADEVVGFAELSVENKEVCRLYVTPKVARARVGTRLLAKLEAVARLHGLEILTLDASLNAVSFYVESGYREVRRDTLHVGGTLQSYVAMEKVLSDQRAMRAPPCSLSAGG